MIGALGSSMFLAASAFHLINIGLMTRLEVRGHYLAAVNATAEV